MGVIKRVRQRIAELIGGTRTNIELFTSSIWNRNPTTDWTRGDYAFWDRARRGQARGLEISGVLLKPITSKIAAWTMGRQPKFTLEDGDREQRLNTWWGRQHAHILRAYEEMLNLGDMYLVFNGDGTLTMLPPNVVRPIVDPNDYSKVIGWRVNQVFGDPGSLSAMTMAIEDQYYADRRVRIRRGGNVGEMTEEFSNPLGLIPVVKLSNFLGADEAMGKPECEALLHMLHRYNDVLEASLEGNIRQGRSILSVEGFATEKALDRFWDEYGTTETVPGPDGPEMKRYLDISSDDVLTMSGGASAKFLQPGSFANDTQILLQILYYLAIEHSEIPEFIMGSAIQGSKASAESQLDPFVKFIEKKQGGAGSWVIELANLYLAWDRLVNSRSRVVEEPGVMWPSLSNEDGKLTLEAIKWAHAQGILPDDVALRLLPARIENPEQALSDARAQAVDAADRFDRQVEREAAEMYVPELRVIMREQAGHTGVMVALPVPLPVAQALYQAAQSAGASNLIAPEDMHITLAYLGDMNSVMARPETIELMLRKFATWREPVRGLTGGLGRFNTREENNTQAVYASVDSPGLAEMRAELVRDLMNINAAPMQNHGFTPHITLAYVPNESATPDIRVPMLNMEIDAMLFAWGDQHTMIALGHQYAEAAQLGAD